MTCRSAFSRRQLVVLLAFVLIGFLAASFTGRSRTHAQGGIDVLTRNYNNQRTGANLSETILNHSNVNPEQFGKLFVLPVDDQVYASPLIVSSLSIAGGAHNVVYITTLNNSVYAFDADTLGEPLWKRNFNDSGRPTFHKEVGQACGAYRDFIGNIGIVGTPVIDKDTKTMYFVTRTVENGATLQKLRAIDIVTGNERPNSPQEIRATIPGTGGGSVGGMLSFNPVIHNQRPALALSDGVVYIGWASFCDTGAYHGWFMAYDATSLAQVGVFNATPNGNLGGIWMSGAGPAFDSKGNLYIGTGNGSFNVNAGSFGNSILKLSPRTLNRLDFYTASNFAGLNSRDLDFGSQGPVMAPGTDMLITGGKEGKFYLLNIDNLGQIAPGDTQIPQFFQAADMTIRPNGTHHLHNSSPMWVSPQGLNTYVWAENDYLKIYRFDPSTQKFTLPPEATGSILPPVGMPGGMMTVTANGSRPGTGIVWVAVPRAGDANQNTVPGHLYAFNAENLALLWSSEGPGDDTLNFSKGSPPIVANGKVYVNSISNFVSVYGLRTAPPAPQNLALNRPAIGSAPCDPSQSAGKAFNGSAEGGPEDKWCSSEPNPFIQVDLGANFSVSRFVVEHAGSGGEAFGNNTSDYLLSVSLDGTNFSNIVGVSGNIFSITTHDVPPIPARFVRLTSLDSSVASIYDLQVYGSPAPTTPDFALTASPNSETVVAGNDASFATRVDSLNGFAGSATLSVSGLPSGATANFSPETITGSGSSTLTITTNGPIQYGTFPLTITATSGSQKRTTIHFLNINRFSEGSLPVDLAEIFNTPAIATDGRTFTDGGLDGGGSSYSANLLGSGKNVTGIPFTFGPPDTLDGVFSRDIPLPAGRYATLGMLATAVNGNQMEQGFTVTYTDGTTETFGQSVSDWFTPMNVPGESIALRMGYRNNADGMKDERPFNLYSYFFNINPAKTIASLSMPRNDNIIILAITLAPSPNKDPDFALFASPASLSLTRGASITTEISVASMNDFGGGVTLSASGLPDGVKASFSPITATGTSTLTLTASTSVFSRPTAVTINGTSGGMTRSLKLPLAVATFPVLPVDLSSAFFRRGIFTDGTVFSTGGLDTGGFAFSANLLGSSLKVNGVPFDIGPANAPDVAPASNHVIPLPAGQFSSLQFLATAVNGNQRSQMFKVTYSDGSTDTFTQNFSDWFSPQRFPGESIALAMPYRIFRNGGRDNRTFNLYHYSFGVNGSKVATTLTLPNNQNVILFAVTLVKPASLTVLNGAAANALSFNGSVNVNVDGALVVNSTDDSALRLFGSGNFRTTNTLVSGGMSQGGSFVMSPEPQLKTPQMPDPLKGLASPSSGIFQSDTCDQSDVVVNGGTVTLNPGTYCNGITINGPAAVTFTPGIYIMLGGGLKVNNTHPIPATLTGTGVTFFLTQKAGYQYGPLAVDGKVVATLKAPTSGPLEGILVFQDPGVGAGATSFLKGSVTATLEGVVYLPTTGLLFGGSVAVRESKYLVLVADTISQNGALELVLKSDFSGLAHGSPFTH